MSGAPADSGTGAPAGRAGLETRARTRSALRAFFDARGYLEVETPVRLPTPALELHIDAEPAGAGWLRTSPELHMKRLLTAGHERLYQIGPCFRQGEFGVLHHPEFTMLEWYRAGADDRSLLDEMQTLIRAVARAVTGGGTFPSFRGPVDTDAAWAIYPVSEAFTRWAGWDPAREWDAERFDRDLVFRVEPALPRDRPCVLTDYPAPAAALARLNPADPRVAARWELYIAGVEVANAYDELTDAAEQEDRFRACAAARRAMDRPAYDLDEPFLAALRAGLPACGGVALGVDRLAMLLAGADTLDAVIAFRDRPPEGRA